MSFPTAEAVRAAVAARMDPEATTWEIVQAALEIDEPQIRADERAKCAAEIERLNALVERLTEQLADPENDRWSTDGS